MGGSVILIATIIPTLLWADLWNEYIWLATATLVMFGVIGFADDLPEAQGSEGEGRFRKDKAAPGDRRRPRRRSLHLLQGAFLTQLSIPFFKHATPDLGIFYLAVCVLIMVGTSNGVNLTDGLDGLAIGPGHHRLRDLPPLRLPGGKYQVRPIPPDILREGRRRAHHTLRGDARSEHRFPLVQRLPRRAFHGRYGLPLPGRGPRRHCRHDQAGISPGDRRGHIRAWRPCP